MEYIGEIVIARIEEIVDPEINEPYYKCKAVIKTGHLEGEKGYVAYRGDELLKLLNRDVLIRLEEPFEDISNLNLEGSITSNFVTSNTSCITDYGSEFAHSGEVIFYGIWKLMMRDGPNAPIISKIKNYYDIGIIPSVLHFEYEHVHRGSHRRKIVPYRLHGLDSEKMLGVNSNGILTIDEAVLTYLRRIDTLPQSNTMPGVVTIGEECPVEKILDGLAKTKLMLIEMEPQQ